jgi:peptidoglycan hydrolase-like protein with peptidoglycan-binding domain
MLHDPNRRDIFPGERAIVLSEPRRDWRAGASALVVVVGAAVGSWLTMSSPQDASMESLVPAAEAAGLFADQMAQPHRLNRAGPVQEAQATTAPSEPVVSGQQMQVSTPLTHDDLVKVQERLKALGYDPGTADGRPGKRTLQSLNEYRKSLGLQATDVIDRQAVAPLTP